MGDTQETATPITIGQQTSVPVSSLTTEAFDSGLYRSVWYSFAPTTDALVLLDTRTSTAGGADLVMNVYISQSDGLKRYRYSDDDIDALPVFGMQAFAEHAYLIQIGTYSDSTSGDINFIISDLDLGSMPVKPGVEGEIYSTLSLKKVDRFTLSPDGTKVAGICTVSAPGNPVNEELWIGKFDPTSANMTTIGQVAGNGRSMPHVCWLDDTKLVAPAANLNESLIPYAVLVVTTDGESVTGSQVNQNVIQASVMSSGARSDSPTTAAIMVYDVVGAASYLEWGQANLTISGLSASCSIAMFPDTAWTRIGVGCFPLPGGGWYGLRNNSTGFIVKVGASSVIDLPKAPGTDPSAQGPVASPKPVVVGNTFWLIYSDDQDGRPRAVPVDLTNGTYGQDVQLAIPVADPIGSNYDGYVGDSRAVTDTSMAVLYGQSPGRWAVAHVDFSSGGPEVVESYDIGNSVGNLSYEFTSGRQIFGRVDPDGSLKWMARGQESRSAVGFDRSWFYLRAKVTTLVLNITGKRLATRTRFTRPG